MVRRSMRLRALVVLMVGIALAPAAVARAQANDPFGAAPPAHPAPPAEAAVAVRSEAPVVRAAEDGRISVAAASTGLGTHGSAEAKILAALNDKTECDFNQTPLADVVDYFKNYYHIEIQFDQKALQDEAIDSAIPITRSLKGVKFKSALRMILDNLNLAYVIRDEVLMITSTTVAEAMLETRAYPVQDLLTQWPAGELRGRNLVTTVTDVINPCSWDEHGGPGSIQLLPGTLVVSQTQALHEELADLLAVLRRVKQAQIAEKGAADAAAAGDAKPAAKPAKLMRIAVYRVPNNYGAGLRDAIVSLIEPQTWKENGGEGSIQLIRSVAEEKATAKTEKPTAVAAGAPAATSGTPAETAQPSRDEKAQVFVVRQADDVHEAIDDLLESIERPEKKVVRTYSSSEPAHPEGGGLFSVRP